MTNPTTFPWTQEEKKINTVIGWLGAGFGGWLRMKENVRRKNNNNKTGGGGGREVLRAGALKILFLIPFAIKSLHRHCS